LERQVEKRNFISPLACQEKKRRAWTKIQENELVHGKKIGPVDTQ
jgi:hypothetical protein